ncbi:MAG: hypothetical protein AAB250_09730, partial [Bdellovibrionota bacterium]
MNVIVVTFVSVFDVGATSPTAVGAVVSIRSWRLTNAVEFVALSIASTRQKYVSLAMSVRVPASESPVAESATSETNVFAVSICSRYPEIATLSVEAVHVNVIVVTFVSVFDVGVTSTTAVGAVVSIRSCRLTVTVEFVALSTARTRQKYVSFADSVRTPASD